MVLYNRKIKAPQSAFEADPNLSRPHAESLFIHL